MTQQSTHDAWFKLLNDLLHAGEFDVVDDIMLWAHELDLELAVTILTATFPARHRLKNRRFSINRLEVRIPDDEEDKPQLLKTLRG